MENGPELINGKEKLQIHDFESAKQFLFERLQDSDKKLFGRERGIVRTEAWLESLGNPQESFPSVHIAGTSGKGSTAYLMSALLKASQQTVGTITSPHVYDVRERLLIDGNYITQDEFTKRAKDIIKPIARLEQTKLGRPTYFEVLVGMAHKCFADHTVNYAVVETGIGGRFDSTNTIKRDDKLAIITRLGIDHTEILGKTPGAIAWQKAGIIPTNGHSIALLPDNMQAQEVIEQVAKARNSTIDFLDTRQMISNLHQTTDGLTFDYQFAELTVRNIKIPTLGIYQAENACLAISALKYLSQRDGFEFNETTIKEGLSGVHIPARAEITKFNGTTVIIDSAHNPQKLQAFFSTVESLKLPVKPLVVFSAKQAKDWEASIPTLNTNAEEIFVTGFFLNQPGHLQKYSADPDKIASKIRKLGGRARAFNSPTQALSQAINQSKPNQPVIITGSMYMLGELHDHLRLLS